MKKSRSAYRTISEVEELLGTQAHVLRYWESQFAQINPMKRAGNRRYYRPSDIELIAGIRKLLHDDGVTIKGVKKILHEQGVQHVASLVPSPLNGQDAEDGRTEEMEAVDRPLLTRTDATDATRAELQHLSKQISMFGQVVHLSGSAVGELDSEGRRKLVRCYDRLQAIRTRLSARQSGLRAQFRN